jgi:hypothetical protein
MTSLDRARAFLKEKVKATALVVVPLAVAAVNANAGVILLPSNPVPVFATQDGDTSDSVNTSTLPSVNGFAGIKLYGSSSTTGNSGGGTGLFLGAGASGGATGVIDSPLTAIANYTFTITSTLPVHWFVNAFLGTSLGGYSDNRSGIGTGLITGTFSLSDPNSVTTIIPAGTAITDWAITVTTQNCDDEDVCIDVQHIGLSIPQNSIDLTTPGSPSSQVPEPTTYMMLGTGFAGLTLLRLRKRKAAQE